ncbi:hypothetical protein F4559_003064 [Saccharothrix violaceirubra]|uniref:Uncharacterized protein n=1 Tax=Saccharothrix violaceirubra TaxID=413306 RepID=A0A7W7WVV1_9PSEU|nr:hypothetical protein [Saccharothrix violaceirubra]
MTRVCRGESQPGIGFVVGALSGLAPLKFEDLFEIV